MSAAARAPGRPLYPRVLAYCLQFARAGWSMDDIAWLFDLDVAVLTRSLQRRA